MVKYKLSALTKIMSAREYADAFMPEAYYDSHHILRDSDKGLDFLINGSVKYFLEKFYRPRTKTEVISEIANDLQRTTPEISQKCSSFFKFLCKKSILVPETLAQPESSRTTLLKQGDYLDGLLITDILANKRFLDVYLVRDETEASSYVIKLLNRKKANDKHNFEQEFEDLESEYRMLASVSHLSCVNKAYSISRAENPYIKLEYIPGRSLSRFLHQGENLDVSQLFNLINNVLQSFASLHLNNIIHGDIHPSNILVTPNNSTKIIDLGLALKVNTASDEVMRIGGVHYYMPPERINIKSVNKFSGEPDLRSDVYQIGALIYFILYRREIFSAFIWEDLARKIKKSEVHFAPLTFLNISVSHSLIEILKKCINKVPSKRYKNASEISKDFKDLVATASYPMQEMNLS